MVRQKKSNYEKALASVPVAAVGDVDGNTLEDIVACIETQIDLIEEGQDGAENYTRRDVAAMKRWVAKWKPLA